MNDLILVERCVAQAHKGIIKLYSFTDRSIHDSGHTELVKKCSDIAQLKGIQALRMSYLYDGQTGREATIPPLKIFVENHYKKYRIPDISIEKLNKII